MEQKIFLEDSFLETQTSYHPSGKIVTDLCSFELDGDAITPDGDNVSMVGRMNVSPVGRSVFTPFRQGTGSRYTHLYDTPHADVKESKSSIIVTFRFAKRTDKSQICIDLDNEAIQIQNWINTLKTKTVWK